jgi:hypothetical protein
MGIEWGLQIILPIQWISFHLGTVAKWAKVLTCFNHHVVQQIWGLPMGIQVGQHGFQPLGYKLIDSLECVDSLWLVVSRIVYFP